MLFCILPSVGPRKGERNKITSTLLRLAETRFFMLCFFGGGLFITVHFSPLGYHYVLSCPFSSRSRKQTTLSIHFLSCLYLFLLRAHNHLLRRTQTGTAVTCEPVSPCVLMECVPPCSHRPVFGEEAQCVPLSSGPPTPLRAQTFSSFSPSKSYSRQSSSSDTELSLTPKTGKIPHLT